MNVIQKKINNPIERISPGNFPQYLTARQQVYPNETGRKIDEFAGLENGWSYGNSPAFSNDVIDEAKFLNTRAWLSGLKTNAIPGINGDVVLFAFQNQYSLELTINPDKTISVIIEDGEEDIESDENLDFLKAVECLNNFSINPKWRSSEYYISTRLSQSAGFLQATPASTQVPMITESLS